MEDLRVEGRLASPASTRGGQEEHVDDDGFKQKNGDSDGSDDFHLPWSITP